MSASRSLLALDFDGVLCDSCPESSLSAWKVCGLLADKLASVELWPAVFEGVGQEEKVPASAIPFNQLAMERLW
eukprot:1632051-Pyramimonas_sp.AAC.1